MSELAFNINGEPFELPGKASAWLVKQMRGKAGPPPVAFGKDGLPLHLDLDATVDDLKAAVTASGRYRLDLVDENYKALADAPQAYVQINLDPPANAGASTPSAKPTDLVVVEAIRSQSAMALAVIERFPQMMDSAANLLRAADGAGLPAREPRLVANEDEDNDETATTPAASPGFDLNALVAQVVPIIITSLTSGKLKLPGLGEMFDWRKATPKPTKPVETAGSVAHATATRTTHVESPPETSATATEALPPIDPQTMMHFIAIQSALAPDEAALAREVAGELGPVELRTWFDELSKLSVPDAVVKIRALIGSSAPAATKGGVS